MRTIGEMIAGAAAPIAPGGDAAGRLLADLDGRACRFPVARAPDGHRFCAMPVEPRVWAPGKVGRCYCRFHRDFLARQISVVDDHRVLP